MDRLWPWLGDAAATAARRADLWRRLVTERPWPADGVLRGERLSATPHAGFVAERWRLTLNHEQAVPALLLQPCDADGQPVAPRGLVLYHHAHGARFEIGKEELLDGRPALQAGPYAAALAGRPEHGGLGCAVLAIDHWGFGERRPPEERALVKRLLWQGETLWGWRVHDALAALQWWRGQAPHAGGQVSPAGQAVQIAGKTAKVTLPVISLGLSMGSTLSVWCAALDDTIDACVDLCGLADWQALLDSGGFDGHAEYYFVPGLLRGWSAGELAALIAPRPHCSGAGRADPLTPPEGLARVDALLRQAHAALGSPTTWQPHVEDGGHAETPTMRAAVRAFLDRVLSKDTHRPAAG